VLGISAGCLIARRSQDTTRYNEAITPMTKAFEYGISGSLAILERHREISERVGMNNVSQ
jgi:hypothetical protein